MEVGMAEPSMTPEPFGFAHCPECGTVWVNVRSALHVHPCPAKEDHVHHPRDLLMPVGGAREDRIRRIRESVVELPVFWAERVLVQT